MEGPNSLFLGSYSIPLQQILDVSNFIRIHNIHCIANLECLIIFNPLKNVTRLSANSLYKVGYKYVQLYLTACIQYTCIGQYTAYLNYFFACIITKCKTILSTSSNLLKVGVGEMTKILYHDTSHNNDIYHDIVFFALNNIFIYQNIGNTLQ